MTHVLLENAYASETIGVAEIAGRLLLDLDALDNEARRLVALDLVERLPDGSYRITDPGRAAWQDILKQERAEVLKREGLSG